MLINGGNAAADGKFVWYGERKIDDIVVLQLSMV